MLRLTYSRLRTDFYFFIFLIALASQQNLNSNSEVPFCGATSTKFKPCYNILYIIYNRLTVVWVSFCNLTKGITPKIWQIVCLCPNKWFWTFYVFGSWYVTYHTHTALHVSVGTYSRCLCWRTGWFVRSHWAPLCPSRQTMYDNWIVAIAQ